MDPILLQLLMASQGIGGDYGSGVDPMLLQLLLPNLAGLNAKGAKDVLDIESKKTNLSQDNMSDMLDPLVRILLGTYTPPPQQYVEPEPVLPPMVDTPTLSSYLNMAESNPNDPWAKVAVGFKEGRMTQADAWGLLRKAPGSENMDEGWIRSQIDAMASEAAAVRTAQAKYEQDLATADYKARQAQQKQMEDDPFVKAGLPSPLERYTDDLNGDGRPDNAPIDGKVLNQLLQRVQDTSAAAERSAKWRSDEVARVSPPIPYDNIIAQEQGKVGESARRMPTDGRPGVAPGAQLAVPYTTNPIFQSAPPARRGPTPGKTADHAERDAGVHLAEIDKLRTAKAAAEKGNNRFRDLAYNDRVNASSALADLWQAERVAARTADAQGRTPLSDNLTQTLYKLLLMRH